MKNRDEADLTEIQWQKIKKYCVLRKYKGSFLASPTTDKVRAYVNDKVVEVYPEHVPDPFWNKSVKEITKYILKHENKENSFKGPESR